jgi:hypothetical protein
MKKLSLFIITSLFLFNSAYAAKPTLEGLFRNSNSPELDGNLVVVKVMVEESSENRASQAISTEEQDLKTPMNPKFYKFIFSLEDEKLTQLLQVEYKNNLMNKNDLKKSLYFKNITEKIKEDAYTERSLFYSLLMMFSLNKSDGMKNILQKYGSHFIDNKGLMNAEKIQLMDQYKKYLSAIKEDKTLKEELVSPLRPEDIEEKEKVNTLLKEPMYKNNDSVSLVKEGRHFFWQMNLETIRASFTNEEHRLHRFELDSSEGNIVGNFGDYILFDGRHELPKIIVLKDKSERQFKIRFLSFKNFVNKGKNLLERAIDYKKLIEEVELKQKVKEEAESTSEVNEKIKPETIFIY